MQEMDAENTIEDEDGDSTFFKRKIAYKELLDSIENVGKKFHLAVDLKVKAFIFRG